MLLLAAFVIASSKPQARDTFVNEKLVGSFRQPVMLPAFLKGKPIISASRIKTKETPTWTYIYRYSFKGDFDAALRKMRRELKGWTFDNSTPLIHDFRHPLKKGPIALQGLLFFPTRFTADSDAPQLSQNKAAWEKGWIWVSYNERLRN